MRTKIEIVQNEVVELINDLQPAQNPVWERPSDERIIEVLTDVLMTFPILDNVVDEMFSERDEIETALDDCKDELDEAGDCIDTAIDSLKKIMRLLK